jgi:hypothetical protein
MELYHKLIREVIPFDQSRLRLSGRLISNGSHAKRGFEITLRPHYYKVFVEGSGEALFTKRASPVNAYKNQMITVA